MAVHDVTDFTIVDRTQDPGFYQRFLDQGNALQGIGESKALLLDGLRLTPGLRVLDVGCGLGDDVCAIAERVGPSGAVVGADVSEAMIEEARRRAPAGAPATQRGVERRRRRPRAWALEGVPRVFWPFRGGCGLGCDMSMPKRPCRKSYPSDLTDEEWDIIADMIPVPFWLPNLQEPLHHPREMLDAMRY